MEISRIWVNGIEKPMGFNYEPLIISWLVEDAIGDMQKNVNLTISKDTKFKDVIFNMSGNLDSQGIKVDVNLEPRKRYYISITVESDLGLVTSNQTYFETGKINECWEAQWIGPLDQTIQPTIETEIKLEKEISDARLYISGVGLYEAYLNEKKIGDEILTPFFNNYDSFIQVQTYDITDLLKNENKLKILLGDGWYKGKFGLNGQKNNFGNKNAVIAELIIRYKDGSVEKIISNENWKCYNSSIVSSGIYDGEYIDKTIPIKEYQLTTIDIDKEKLVDRISPKLKIQEKIKVKEIIYSANQETILDFGQNFAGWITFENRLESGRKVHFDFGEILQNGCFYNENYQDAKGGFTYVSDGNREIVRPHFTYYGFRYVKITGFDNVKKEDFTGLSIYSSMERTGFIETGNEKVNKLCSNSLWSLKSNFIDMPTDCPQRSERLGWTGDAQVFTPTASYFMDTRAFYRKFLKDMKTEQNKLGGSIPNYLPAMNDPGGASVWGDAATFIPFYILEKYGCIDEVAQYYPLMKDWVDWLGRKIEKAHGKKYDLNDINFQFGDWLALDGVLPSSFKGGTDEVFIATVYYYASLKIISKIASLMNNDDYLTYSDLAKKVKERILEEYYTPSGRLSVDTQTAYIIALKFSVYRDKNVIINQYKQRIRKDLYKLKSGFVGTTIYCQVLAENGLIDLAYELLLNEEYPGWIYAINLGATTIWERWNSVLPDGLMNPVGMNSLNHYSYGSIVEFLFKYSAGIKSKVYGFKNIILKPMPNINLKKMNCCYNSLAGKIVSNWKILDDGKISFHFEIPFNTKAIIFLPYTSSKPIEVKSGIYDYVYTPDVNLLSPYNNDTRISIIKKNKEVYDKLLELDQNLKTFIMNADEEQINYSINELSNMFYTGITKETACRTQDFLMNVRIKN